MPMPVICSSGSAALSLSLSLFVSLAARTQQHPCKQGISTLEDPQPTTEEEPISTRKCRGRNAFDSHTMGILLPSCRPACIVCCRDRCVPQPRGLVCSADRLTTPTKRSRTRTRTQKTKRHLYNPLNVSLRGRFSQPQQARGEPRVRCSFATKKLQLTDS